MLLFTMVYNNEREDLIDKLVKLKEYFQSRDVVIGLSENIEDKTHFIKIYCEEKFFNKKVINSINDHLVDILYDTTIDRFIKVELNKFITDAYFFLKREETEELLEKISDVLKDKDKRYIEDSIYCLNKKNEIIKKIKKCIDENNEINIDGFLTFRCRELFIDIKCIVEKIVEKYMVDKEYNEFIKLLKYFVEIEESKLDKLNILIDPTGKYTLKDSEGNDLTEEVYIEISDVKYVENISVDDMLISWLITNVPKEINIYNIENCTNKELINTIKNVFEERVNIYNHDKPIKLKHTYNKL
ncbi:putative sporulation protein YtxC [Clostridium botulinum]|uniref:putative sporulation protein YtxC n=1 Tax=Clostridium botulinum TaxID=1491 RepID=UPI001A91E6F3|nr:putative sporulation protein YtxC [Clostridium botulinum]EKO1914369.1 putative sporulation protein YtxC [Clostridium botulinum]EKO2044411.1 putative sporulation protein YtxC [Clostridium botulinum]MBO0536680.1 putative sporulation protein YtxC [Clostridium botulinum]MBO0539716.1 putative sporulation protein YtxC [Clostridium botulinum]MBO0543455.1 putative sporulation protein YtxC [Clostridium botulinum]